MQATVETSVAGVRDELLAFICRTFVVEQADVDLDRSLIEQGIIDSFGLVEITTFIAQRFGVEVKEEDLTREAFGSTNKMARFVVARVGR